MSAQQPAGAVVVRVHGPVTAARALSLCARLEAHLLQHDPVCVLCRVRGRPDLSVVDVLARIVLISSRRHAAVRVTTLCSDLQGLLTLAGLASVVVELEAAGQAETGEEGGVEEVVDVDDLPA